jgi:SAM-dependent methyltransferase
MGLSVATAEVWVDRWERQQMRYAVDREERFTVITDVVEHVTEGQNAPQLVDLGCGPGSLAARLSERLPHADIVGVDMDPLLLELARTRHGNAARYVDAVIGEEGWTDALDMRCAADAIISTTALHYLSREALKRTYAQLAQLLRPGGAFINGDHFGEPGEMPARIVEHVGRRRAERQHVFSHEDWESWWASAADAPELAELVAKRWARQASCASDERVTLSEHVTLLGQAGFQYAAPVWQFGNSYVLVAIR